MEKLTHLDAQGNAHMVDVGAKAVTERKAQASGEIRMSRACFDAVESQSIQKGDVLAAARIAGIMGAKRTSDIIPLCHPLALSQAAVDFELDAEACRIVARCSVRCTGRTGVEMEALTGVSAALLTIYDMCKAVDRSMEMGRIHLESKSGGRSGEYLRSEEQPI